MRATLIALFLSSILMLAARAQDAAQPAPDGVLQKFEGTAPLTSPAFTVNDHWEIRWNALAAMNLSVLGADGSVVAGSNSMRGALYLAKGGTYRLQIDCTSMQSALGTTPQAPAPNPNRGPSGPTGFQNTLNGGLGGGDQSQNDAQKQQQAARDQAMRDAEARRAQYLNQPWKVEVVDMAAAAARTYAGLPNFVLPLTASSPFGTTTPPVASTAAPNGATPPTPGKLTEDQASAVVLITGDNAEGTGFLIKTPDGPAVITNIHVIANNPNLKITTTTGALVTVLSEKGASDRDLAMLAIKDAGYNYLDVSTDISQSVQPGDEVITPGNSQGGQVMLNTAGKVLGIGPERIEFDNPIYHGNSGGPVFHTKSGKVLGVVTEAMKVNMTNDLDKASFASRNSAITGAMRYFGLRLDTVSAWVAIDSRTFQIETTFLDQFHEQSKRLDSYLNTSDKGSSENSNGGQSSGGSGDAKLYLTDSKIMKANDNFVQQAAGSDTAQRLQALRGLLFDLQSIADLNVSQISNTNNFYSFDRERARDELGYRKALKDELNRVGNDIERLGNLPRSN